MSAQILSTAPPPTCLPRIGFLGMGWIGRRRLEALVLANAAQVAAIIDPSIIRAHYMHVEIETTGEWTSGSTVCDVYGKLGKEPNARVGYALDVPRFWEMVISTILTYE